MNPDLLAQLRDIHPPPPVGWWPPAPGWWGISLLLIILLGFGGLFFLRLWRKNRYRRQALKKLDQLARGFESQSFEAQKVAGQIAVLLRRVAIHGFGRQKVADLAGEAWLTFLDATGGTDQFTRGPGRFLGRDLYRPVRHIELDPLVRLAEQWIRSHRPC